MEHIDQQKNLRRVVISSILGAVIEWYDFFLYGVVAGLFFNQPFSRTLTRASGPCLPSPRSRWGLWPVLWEA